MHPLLATRGVPGTHDIDLLQKTLDALRKAATRHPARVPRFDKGLDTRLAPSRWRPVARMPELVILEGWCIGVPPQGAAALARPVNRLERDEDRSRELGATGSTRNSPSTMCHCGSASTA